VGFRLVARVPVIVLVLLVLPHTIKGQSAPLRVSVAPGASVKSPPITVATGDAVVVRLADADAVGTPVVRVFIHTADGTLAATDDPEQSSDAASFALPAGSYYAILRNAGDARAVLSISTERVRDVARGGAADLAIMRVFYVTDRERLATPVASYGDEPAKSLSFGHADVTIPRAAHDMGELEGPSIWRLEFAPNEEKHVVMRTPVPASEQAFFRALSERLKVSTRRECLVFVHGFNVSFEDAVRRTGQIAYDLAWDGVPVLFSWPSQDSALPMDYRKDERNAALSADSLREFLTSLAARVPGLTVHVVAHSMGSRVVTAALQQLAVADSPNNSRKLLRQVALLAPDIDAELFRRAVSKLAGVVDRLTLYASDNDDALVLSQRNAGYRRAGQGGQDLVIAPDIDTIDATQVKTSLLGLRHLYYADNSTILADLFHLLRGRPPSERSSQLERAGTPPNTFWRFRRAAR
jgi:esterase/lipase superfamily enzyme